MGRYRRIIVLLCLGLLCGLAAGCDEREVKAAISKLARTVSANLIGDLEEARIALREREWNRAARYLERFLRTAMDQDERWEAWNSLIDATERASQDRRWISAYLETMLVEFEDDPVRRREVLYRMGEMQEMSHQYERATLTWSQLSMLSGLSPEERLSIFKRLASLQMRLNRLQDAEDALHECLSLPLSDNAKGDCLYSLADISALRGDLTDSANIASQILDIQELSQELYGKTAFLLADVYEQQQKYAEALQLYLTIRETYPNPLAVGARIAYLEKKVKK